MSQNHLKHKSNLSDPEIMLWLELLVCLPS